MSDACKCAASYELTLSLLETAHKWIRDPTMQKYILDHIDRVSTGLGLIEKQCALDVSTIRDTLKTSRNDVVERNWDEAHGHLDETYVRLALKVADCAGYRTPHF